VKRENEADASVTTLCGLGPKLRDMLARVGITTTADELQASDPFKLYARIKAVEHSASLNLLYALIAAIENRDWRDVAREDKTRILMRLDDLGVAPNWSSSTNSSRVDARKSLQIKPRSSFDTV
jgi:DNA transformation protein and related proteins